MPLLIAVVVFLTVLVGLAALIYYLSSSRRNFAARLSNYVELPTRGIDIPALPRPTAQNLSGWRAFVRRMSKYFDSPRWTRNIERKLIQAGVLLRASEFMVICAGAAILGAVMMLLFTGRFPAATLGLVLGFFAPQFVLQMKAAKRVRLFNDQLGDALVLVANSLRIGYSFLQSVEMVAKEMPEPIAGEFSRALKEMTLGVTTEQAMNNLARRVDSDDLDLVVTAVLIQRQVGGNLAEVLENIAGTIRARVKLKGEIRSLTAQGRVSGIILAVLPPVIGVITYLVNPTYISLLFTHPLGQAMIAGAIVSQVFGVFIIRRIVNIDL